MPEVEQDEFDEDYGHDDDSPPYWFAETGNAMPEIARRMGLTHHVPEGAILDFAGNLDSSKVTHRIAAWVMLVVFCLPVAFYIVRLVLDVVHA